MFNPIIIMVQKKRPKIKYTKMLYQYVFFTLSFWLSCVAWAGPVAVISTSPANNATAVPLASSIQVVFDQEIYATQVKLRAYYLKPDATPSYVGGTISYTNKILTLKGSYNLWGSTRYYVEVLNAVSTTGGATLAAHRFQFTTTANLAPTATSAAFSTPQNTPVAVRLTATDPEKDTMYYILVSSVSNGTLTGTAPNYTYTPRTGFTGEDSFSFYVRDSVRNQSNTATVKITVGTSANTAPVANPQTVAATTAVARAITLTASDKENNPLTYRVTTQPLRGTLSGTAPNLIYTSNAGFIGTDSFTFVAQDASLSSNTATVSINVSASTTNTAPVANPQTVAATTAVARAITLTASDKESNPLTYRVTTQPLRGTLSGTAPNLMYTSNAGFTGTDSFTFVAQDASLSSNTATVSINVSASTTNTAPVAQAQTINATSGVSAAITLRATDAEGNPLTYRVTTQPLRGTLAGVAPNLLYTSSASFIGADSFSFVAQDATLTSNTASVSLNVTAPTSPPPTTPQPLPDAPGKVSLLLDSPALMDKYPVFSGVPFPQGVLKNTSQLMVENALGTEIPAQFEVLSRWIDGSIKAVLVIVSENITSLTQQYYLRYDQTVAKQYNSPLQVSDFTSYLQVNTGVLRFNISKTAFRLFDQAWIDQNKDQNYDASEQIISQAGDIFFLNALDGQEYTSSRFASPVVTIEEQGPVRTVIKAKGKLQAANGQVLTDFTVRIFAYAHSDKVQVDYTLVDTREEADVDANRSILALSGKAWGLRMPLNLSGEKYVFGGEGGQTYSGNVVGNHYLYQSGQANYIDGSFQPYSFAYSGVGSGQKAPGWLDVSDAGKGVTVSMRDFWQQFPAELAVDPNQLLISLHPARAAEVADTTYPALNSTDKIYKRPNTFYFPREGGAKTHRLTFAFHAGAVQPSKASALNDIFQSPRLLLSGTAAWYTRSKVFGDLIPTGPSSAGFDDYLIKSYYQRSIEEVKNTGGLAVQYGWRDFGDRMRGGWGGVSPEGVRIPSFYNDTHVGATNFLAQYLRTKDVRWFELGQIATRHFMDIDVSHANRKWYRYPKGFGPGEIHASGHESVDHHGRNGHPSHAHVSGLPEYYWLTGDKRALEVLVEMGSWWANAVPVMFPTPIANPHYAEAERDFGWPLYVLNRVTDVTGDLKYHRAAAQLTKHMIQWWQQPARHLVNGVDMGANDATKGTGFWTMYPRMVNSYGTAGVYNGTSPWMAGALLSALIEFYENNKVYSSEIDNNQLKDMMLQTMNYVVKWGWNNEKTYFKYGESNDFDGGYTHLLYPMAYLYRLYAQGGLANPQWYDTAPKWKELSLSYFNSWKVVKYRSTSASGFYGYEFIYPMDFFTIMETLP